MSDLIEHWYKALHSPYGTIIESTDAALTKQQLYQARTKEDNPDLWKIGIVVLDPGQLWLVKREPDGPAEAHRPPL